MAYTDFIVVMGTLDRYEKNEHVVILDIEKAYYLVDQFNVSTYEHDIAVLILNDTVPITNPNIKPIDFTQKVIPSNTKCRVTGWGITEDVSLFELNLIENNFHKLFRFSRATYRTN